MRVRYLLLIALLFTAVTLTASDVKDERKQKKSERSRLDKAAQHLQETPQEALAQRARAYMSKGQLKLATHNIGKFSGWDPFINSVEANPEGLYKGFQYLAGVSIMVGVGEGPWSKRPSYDNPEVLVEWGPTVSETWFDRTSNITHVDWMPIANHRDRGRGGLHSGELTAGEVYREFTRPDDNTPLLATSDNPITWPTGFYGATGNWISSPIGQYRDLAEAERTLVDSLKAVFHAGESDHWHFWPGPWAVDPNPFSPTYNQPVPGIFFSDQDIYMAFDDRWATRDVDPRQGYPIGLEVRASGFSYGRSFAEDIVFFPVLITNKSDQLVDFNNNGQGWDYKNVYVGFYFDVDSYNKLANGSGVGRTNDDDMMAFNTEQNYAFIWDLDDNSSGFRGLAYSALKFLDSPPAARDLDLDGDGSIDVRQGDKLGMTDWHWFDWYARPGVRAVETNNGPWAGDLETPIAKNAELAMYRVMAGDTTGLTEDQKNWYFWHGHRNEVRSLHFNSLQQLRADYPNGLDCVFIASAGPFDLAVGDTVNASFAIIMGDDPQDLHQNAGIAQLMYDNRYQGPDPPKAPQVSAIVTPYTNPLTGEVRNQITLYWDDRSETYRDILTGYQDFEGYRVYRSTDGGRTWGDPITDSRGNTINWKPLAQCDKINGIGGFDPLGNHLYLGNDKVDPGEGDDGLFHSFTDFDIQDGVEYTYAVAAYDYGFLHHDLLRNPLRFNFDLESLENFKSTSESETNVVKVTPQPRPTNYAFPQVDTLLEAVHRVSGQGLARMELQVLDPEAITGHTYRVVFKDSLIRTIQPFIDSVAVDTLFGRKDTVVVYNYFVDSSNVRTTPKLVFNVLDVDENRFELSPFSDRIIHIDGSASGIARFIQDTLNTGLLTGPEYSPAFDGIRLKIVNVTSKPFFRAARWSGRSDYSVGFEIDAVQRPADYRLRFSSGFPDSAYVLQPGRPVERLPLPFQVFNISDPANPKRVDALLVLDDKPPTRTWSSGDVYSLVEDATFRNTPLGRVPVGTRTWKISLTWFPRDTTVIIPPDTIITEVVDNRGNVRQDTVIIPERQIFQKASTPWQPGDELTITTWKPLSPNDIFEFSTKPYLIQQQVNSAMMDEIRVVPNPYIVSAAWETDPNRLKIQFTNLPSECKISIFNVAGELIKTLHHNSPVIGTADWNLWTENRQEVAYGLYIYVVEAAGGEKKIGKFAIIR
jgi:hypothetical protein